MSLRLTKPGLSATLRHPKTGAILKPIGFLKNGTAVWPVLGAASDDPDDPAYGEGQSDSHVVEDDDDEEDDQEDEDDKPKPKPPVKKKDSDDEDEDADKLTRPERQAARYRIKAREAAARADELAARLKKIEDSDKPADEILKRDLEEMRTRSEQTENRLHTALKENAFLRANTISWADPSDAMALLDFSEIDVDEDGTVDPAQLKRALRDLAKRKPHLVKKSPASDQDDDEDDSQSSASTMNGRRKGTQNKGTDRKALAKRFPVLGG